MIIAPEVTNTANLNFSKVAREKIENGEKLISLGLGEPYFDTPKEIIKATVEALNSGNAKYSNSAGIFELRSLIREKLNAENGIDTEVKNIFVTIGAKQALYVALQVLLRPNDEVINISPSYVSFIPQIKLAEPNSIVKNVDLNPIDLTLNVDSIRCTLTKKTRAIIINSPHNPTGFVLSEKQVNEIADMLQDFPDCYIISDELYEYLNFSDKKHISFASIKKLKNRVFTINGFSKSYSMTGWRIGYMACPPKFANDVAKLLLHTIMNVPTFIQKGACAALSLEKKFVSDYKDNLSDIAKYIKTELDSTCLKMIMPMAGFFCFVDISNTGLTSDEFATQLVSKFNVALNPGIAFGNNWDNFVRISYSGDFEDIKEGVRLLKKFVL